MPANKTIPYSKIVIYLNIPGHILQSAFTALLMRGLLLKLPARVTGPGYPAVAGRIALAIMVSSLVRKEPLFVCFFMINRFR